MWAAVEKHPDVVGRLIAAKAEINARSKGGFTTLMFAAQQGDADSARRLLDAKADPNARVEASGLTPVLIASAMHQENVVALLVEHGADVNAVSKDDFTPLHHAAWHRGGVGVVNLLLKHGAKPNIRLKSEKRQTFDSLVNMHGATPLLLAADRDNLDSVRALIDAGADISLPTETKTPALTLAAGGGVFKANPRTPEERDDAINTVKFLVEKGANVNTRGQWGYTPLHAASYQGLNDVIEYLAQHSANLKANDDFGQTPLSIANAVITKDMMDYQQAPHLIRKDTSDLFLKMGAVPLEKSGIIRVTERANLALDSEQ